MANLASSPVREANDECYMRKLETIRDIRVKTSQLEKLKSQLIQKLDSADKESNC